MKIGMKIGKSQKLHSYFFDVRTTPTADMEQRS